MVWKYIIIFISALLMPSFAALSCTVTNSCPDFTLIKISDTLDAHLELKNESAYAYSVCCLDNRLLLNSSCAGTPVIKLSDITNAHAGYINESSYPISVCLFNAQSVSQGSINNFTVAYKQNNCTGYDTCAFSLSDTNNAHAGNCSAYDTKVCITSPLIITTGVAGVTGQIFAGQSVLPVTTISGILIPAELLSGSFISIYLFQSYMRIRKAQKKYHFTVFSFGLLFIFVMISIFILLIQEGWITFR